MVAHSRAYADDKHLCSLSGVVPADGTKPATSLADGF